MNEESRKTMHREMIAEMRDLLGSGYVPEYYDQTANGFTSIAEWAVDQETKRLREVVEQLRGALGEDDSHGVL